MAYPGTGVESGAGEDCSATGKMGSGSRDGSGAEVNSDAGPISREDAATGSGELIDVGCGVLGRIGSGGGEGEERGTGETDASLSDNSGDELSPNSDGLRLRSCLSGVLRNTDGDGE